jgi:hypothetical protein
MNCHVTLLFLVRKPTKSGRHNIDGVSHPIELGSNMRAGIPRAAANRWILTVQDQDSHTKLRAPVFSIRDIDCFSNRIGRLLLGFVIGAR